MDIIINNPIDLNKYNNDIFTIVTSIRPLRPCIFHNRDWDYLWIGSKKHLKFGTILICMESAK